MCASPGAEEPPGSFREPPAVRRKTVCSDTLRRRFTLLQIPAPVARRQLLADPVRCERERLARKRRLGHALASPTADVGRDLRRICQLDPRLGHDPPDCDAPRTCSSHRAEARATATLRAILNYVRAAMRWSGQTAQLRTASGSLFQPPGQVRVISPAAFSSHQSPQGSAVRHAQLGDIMQPMGSGRHSKESGSPPTSDTPCRQ